MKIVLLLAGLILVCYGAYLLFVPNTSVDLTVAETTQQEHTNAYITMGIGLLIMIVNLFIRNR